MLLEVLAPFTIFDHIHGWIMKRKNAFVLLVVAICVFSLYFLVQFYIGDVQVEFNSQTLNSLATPDHWNTESELKIPLIVHHTWKRTTAPPAELVRWRTGCMRLNRDYTFIMYNDEDLLTFTRQHYQQYLPMFEHLHGVCKSHVVIRVDLTKDEARQHLIFASPRVVKQGTTQLSPD